LPETLTVAGSLEGLRVLVLEDEYLIAMDVEQICLDHGAADVIIRGDLDRVPAPSTSEFDAAVLDIMLQGRSTLDFARRLQEAAIPFVFASGYSHNDEILAAFPEIRLVGKPYAGRDLVDALADARRRISGAG
jgi:DNA-binding response OmpR family regulator